MILSTVKVAKVKKNSNKAILFMPKPQKGNGNLGKTVPSGKRVYIIAKRGEYYFFVTEDGYMGWNGKSQFNDKGTTDFETVLEIIDTQEMYTRYNEETDYFCLLDYLYARVDEG